MVTHAGIIGQVWRRPSRQALLAIAVRSVDVRPLSLDLAKATGILLASTKTADVNDAALALLCEPDDIIFTSDVDDLRALLAERSMTSVGIVRV